MARTSIDVHAHFPVITQVAAGDAEGHHNISIQFEDTHLTIYFDTPEALHDFDESLHGDIEDALFRHVHATSREELVLRAAAINMKSGAQYDVAVELAVDAYATSAADRDELLRSFTAEDVLRYRKEVLEPSAIERKWDSAIAEASEQEGT